LFDSDDNDLGGLGRLGSVPLNHVLEYRVRDADDVWLRSKKRCASKDDKDRHDHQPLSSKKLLQEYERYHRQWPDQSEHPTLSQRSYVARLLERYAYVYFLGVGLRPERDPYNHIGERADHGVSFFNDRLLPAIFQHGQRIPPGSKLKKVGRDVLPCGGGQSISSSPTLRPAVWQDSMSQPRLLTVASTENCSAPAATATGHN
jgi:hypothetical protein